MKFTQTVSLPPIFLFAAICSLLAGLCQPVFGGELIVVALANTQAPGLPEGIKYTFTPFRRWSVNTAGQVVFKANVDGPDGPPFEVIYFGYPGELSPIAMEGDVAPGTDGKEFCTFDTSNPLPSTIASADGKVAFMAKVFAPGSNPGLCASSPVGIWVYENGVTQLLALEDEQAADSAKGVIYSDIRPKFRHSNQGTIFSATLLDGKDSKRAILTGQPGAVQILALAGDAAPDLKDKFYVNFTDSWPHNNSGQSSFLSWFSTTSDRGIYRGDTTMLELVLRSGADASDFLPGYTFRTLNQAQLRIFGLNDAAHACFSSEVLGPQVMNPPIHDTVWRDLGASRAVLARTDLSNSGIAKFEFTAFDDCWINHTGQVLLRGTASMDSDHRGGLWLTSAVGEDPTLSLITYRGDILFNDEQAFEVNIAPATPLEPHINKLGSVAFEVTVVNTNKDRLESIWLSTGAGEQLLALGRQTVTLDNKQQATLGPFLDFGIGENGSGNQDGNPSAISDNDQVVFKTTLDSVDAIVITLGRGDIIFKDSFEDLPK